MMCVLLLLAVLTSGNPPSPCTWTLTVVVERDSHPHFLTERYASRDECVEDMILVALTPTVEGVRFVGARCERDPFIV